MIKPHAYSIWPTVCVNFKIQYDNSYRTLWNTTLPIILYLRWLRHWERKKTCKTVLRPFDGL